MKTTLTVLTIILAIVMVLTAGCIKIVRQGDSQQAAQEPLVSEWQMTRTSIKPAVPIPDIVLNQIISDKATWKIAYQGGQLTIKYDGRDTWYKIPGIPIQKKPTTASLNPNKSSCTFTSGGTITMEKLSGLLSMITSQRVEEVNITFDDMVQVTLNSPTTISAVINVKTSGNYMGETEFGGSMKQKALNQSTTITYEGTKK